MKYKCLLFLFFLGFNVLSFSQTENQFNPLTDDISLRLPSLQTLIDSALVHDPYVRFRSIQSGVNHSKLKTMQRKWTNNLGVQADVRYGTFDNFSTNTQEGQVPYMYATATSQTHFGVGAYIKFPVVDVVDRRNQVHMAKLEIEQAESMAEEQKKEVRARVIQQYNQLIEKQNLIRIQSRYVEMSRVNMQMAEKEFTNGTISIAEFARVSEIATQSETEFESIRMEFKTSYMLLEETTGMEFHLDKINPGSHENH